MEHYQLPERVLWNWVLGAIIAWNYKLHDEQVHKYWWSVSVEQVSPEILNIQRSWFKLVTSPKLLKNIIFHFFFSNAFVFPPGGHSKWWHLSGDYWVLSKMTQTKTLSQYLANRGPKNAGSTSCFSLLLLIVRSLCRWNKSLKPTALGLAFL